MVPQGRKITDSLMKEILKQKISQVEVASNDLEGAYIGEDVVDMSTGEVMIDANQELTPTVIGKLIEAGIESFDVFFPERDEVGTVISTTLRKDPVKARKEALIEIYRKLRPGDPPTVDTATQLFDGMFFDARKYDFSRVGRMKFSIKIHDTAPGDPATVQCRRQSLRSAHPASRRLQKHDQLPAQTAQGHWRGRRYRSPR